MTWIDVIEYKNAKGRLLKLYDQCKNPDGTIDRVLKAHSLRPRTLHSHLILYKATIHTKPNELTYRERELVGCFTSYLNGCSYCVEHHKAGLGRGINDMSLANVLLEEAKKIPESGQYLTTKEIAYLVYTRKLTLTPQEIDVKDIDNLRVVGLSDTGILDLNQLVSYFNYVNRTVNGLGVDLAAEKLGFHPSEDKEGFLHY